MCSTNPKQAPCKHRGPSEPWLCGARKSAQEIDAEDLESLPGGYSRREEQCPGGDSLTSGLGYLLWEKIKTISQKKPGNEGIYPLKGFVPSTDPVSSSKKPLPRAPMTKPGEHQLSGINCRSSSPVRPSKGGKP